MAIVPRRRLTPVPPPPTHPPAGEHGGDPKSIEFVSTLVDYVSCSPLRVPIARLAAAQAAIRAAKASLQGYTQD